ncbi:MAG: exosortase-associated EpsI family protein [Planctomycetes bacterium]|nr:exosortase-associated EpsI family protein [Planctomycetota bacterium]
MRLLPLLLAIGLVAGYGVVEGRWTHRWQASAAVRLAAERLKSVPLHVGDWRGEERELDARQVAKGEIDGYLVRRYVHRVTGQQLSLLLVCGRAGPTSLHTPEVCYPGAGFSQDGPALSHKLEVASLPGPVDFKVGKFHKPRAAVPEALRIFWSWNGDGRWMAPDNARFSLARYPALYKLYVIHRMENVEEPLETDPAMTFLRQFLPEAQRHLGHSEQASLPSARATALTTLLRQ